VALSCGWAISDAGVALRSAARRDRLATSAGDAEAPLQTAPAPRRDGFEAGAGAWVRVSAGVRLWVADAQLVTAGAAPPLARGLESGASWTRPQLVAWMSREAAPRGVGPEAHRLGVAIPLAQGDVWLEARDAPLRVSGGCRVRARGLAVTASVETHPELGETVRLEIATSR